MPDSDFEDEPLLHPTLLRLYDDDLEEVPIGGDHPILLQAILRVNLCGQILSVAGRHGIDPANLPELIQFISEGSGWSLGDAYTTYRFYLICLHASPPGRINQP